MQDLIRTLKLVPGPLTDTDKWPWPVEIRTLGRFEVLRDGKPIEYSRKIQKKPLDILKVLIALGAKEVREESITERLWPDSMGDDAHHSFEVTLKRLRTLLGYPEVLRLHDGRLSLDPRYCQLDVWTFEDLLERKDGGESQVIIRTQKALSMYRGAFLSSETDEFPALRLRERLRSKFLRSVAWLGSKFEESDRWQDALDCYHKGLEVDDLSEYLFRQLIICHTKLGQKGEAISVYHRCRKLLSLVLGITPSPETERLYETIKGTG